MKTIIVSLFMLSVLNTFSQTKLDKLIFKRINEYRAEKGLSELLWDDKAYLAANLHSKYMIKNSVFTHEEKNDTPNHDVRLMKYGVEAMSSAENIAKISHYVIKDEILAIAIFNIWKRSPPHNKIMLSDYKKSAVSCSRNDTTTYSTLVLYHE